MECLLHIRSPYYPSLKGIKLILFIPTASELSVALQHSMCWTLLAELKSIPLPFLYVSMQTGHSWRTTEKRKKGRETEETAMKGKDTPQRKVRREKNITPKFGSTNE